jgi:glycosyltransferase involved in cell wall biosynthesis
MRIAYMSSAVYRHNSSSGGNAHMRQFLTNAAEMGHELVLWHGGDHPHPNIRVAPNSKVRRMLLMRQMDVLYYRIEFRKPRDANWVLPPRRWLGGNPLVVWEFNSVPEFARVLGEPDWSVQKHVENLRHFGAGCDLACCVSNAINAYVREWLGLRNVMTVPNGSDPQLFTPEAKPVQRVQRHPGRLNVVWIGSAEIKWHNFELLRDAAWLLWDDGRPVVDFHIIGQGMQGLRDLPPNVHYHGPEQYERLPNWLTAMDVGLNVYKAGAADYSSPLKLFDYMACGLALVSTDQPQVREIFQKLDQMDLVTPTDDPQALAGVLRKLAADRDRIKRQGAAGRQLVLDFYNWHRAARDTLDAIENLLRQRRIRSSYAAPHPSLPTSAK